jgi:hypothetical protein
VLSLADCSSFSATGMSDAQVGIAFQAVAPAASGPTVTITSPTNGQVVNPHGAATATYSCTGGTPPTTCVGDAPSGSALDTSVSGPKQFHVVASDSTGATTERWVTWTVGQPTVSASGCSVARGAACTFDVTLGNASSKPVTVAYATSDGTATAGSGYTAKSGTVTFQPGETSKPVAVSTNAAGPGGTFTLGLSNPSGASIGTAVANGTITVPPTPKVSVADTTLTRPGTGTSPMVFTVSLPGPAAAAVTVHYATADGTGRALFDYTPTSGTLTIPVGQTSATVSVPVIGNQADDPDKTLLLSIDTPTNATLDRSQATGTILANHQIGGCPANPTQVQRFVCHTYVDALGRTAEPAGRDYWVNLINTGTPRAKMASTYMKTPEARQVLINRIYKAYLQRDGDQEGVNYWADQLLAGRTPDSVRVLILGSDEYFQVRGQSSNLTFVRQMYLDVFRRPVDPSGEAYWTGELASGQSRARVAGRFVRTAEGRQHLVEDIYDRFLRRVPTTNEVNTWVGKLASGSTELDVYVALVASDEYFTR